MSSRDRTAARLLLTLLVLLPSAPGQFSNPEPATTAVLNAAPLHPPAGARVAIIEFEDLECPDCAHASPIVKEAVRRYHIPWVRYDFPLPRHHWSFQAAVDARWFDAQSKELGDQFRDAVYVAQSGIHTEDELRGFASQFAQQHGLTFPAAVDPRGVLARGVQADYALGRSMGILHTPTLWVVTRQTSGSPFVEVLDRSRLFVLIEQAEAETARPRP